MSTIRSLLFVPAEEKYLAKIGQYDANAYIIDLEDSIAFEDKELALKRTVQYLSDHEEKNIFVRINHYRYRLELDALHKFNVGFMLPKIESDVDYAKADCFIENRNVIALIETPRAVVNVNSIASLPWVSALAFGAEDFTAATNMLNSVDTLMVPKIQLILAAKAYGKQVYDTPCFQLKEIYSLRKELQQAVDLGFDGKLAIHPKQVEEINKAFTITDPEYAKHLINVYESCGSSVCEINGRVYEKLHIDRLRKMISAVEERKEGYGHGMGSD